MKKKLSDYVIISDVDGTLLPHNGEVPQRNIDAIKRFISKGGKFGIATGRSKELTEIFVGTIPINAPCVVYNGGGLYDFNKKEFLMQNFLPDTIRVDLEQIRADMPHIAVLVICDNNYYHVNIEIPFANFSEEHRENFRSADVGSLTSPWYKILFSVSPEESDEFDTYIASHKFNGVRFVRTNPTLVELLPETSTKAYALQKLVELGHFSRDQIVAVGDFDNDLEMIKFAAIGATVANAPDELKAAADVVLGTSEGGVVADLVEYLERIVE